MKWLFRPRSSAKSPSSRSRRLEFERLEDRNLLSGDLLLTAWDLGNVNYRLMHYTQAGTQVSSTPVPSNVSLGQARGITVDSSNRIEFFNGTFSPGLTTYVPSSQTWTTRTFPGWSIVNNATYGGIGSFQNFVFAPDMTVLGDANGIVRFDNSGGPTVRFGTGQDFIVVTVGLDGLVYGLTAGPLSDVFVYDPNTTALVRTFPLRNDSDIRSIAVDAAGNILEATLGGSLIKTDPTGANVLATIHVSDNLVNLALDRDGQVAVGGVLGTVYLTDESLTSVTSFKTNETFVFVTFNHYIPGPTTPAPSYQENFIVHPDNQVFGQKFDANGNPSGSPYLVARGSLRSVVSGRDATGNMVLFGIDPYLNHVWELKFDSSGNPLTNFYTPVWTGGAVESIAVGHDGNRNLELFAVDPYIHHVWGMKFNANSDPTDSFTLLSLGELRRLSPSATTATATRCCLRSTPISLRLRR